MELDLAVLRSVDGSGLSVQECARNRELKWGIENSWGERRPPLVYLGFLGAILLHPLQGHAYAGPGAGFAVLSSFWTLFVAFLYSIYAFFVWPFRQLFRASRRRKAYGKAH